VSVPRQSDAHLLERVVVSVAGFVARGFEVEHEDEELLLDASRALCAPAAVAAPVAEDGAAVAAAAAAVAASAVPPSPPPPPSPLSRSSVRSMYARLPALEAITERGEKREKCCLFLLSCVHAATLGSRDDAGEEEKRGGGCGRQPI